MHQLFFIQKSITINQVLLIIKKNLGLNDEIIFFWVQKRKDKISIIFNAKHQFDESSKSNEIRLNSIILIEKNLKTMLSVQKRGGLL